MKIEGILFDFDGTLADTKSLLFESYVQFMDSYDLIPSVDEFNSLSGTPIKSSIVQLCSKYRIKVDSHAAASSYVSNLDRAYLEAPSVSGAVPLIEYVRSKGIPIALVTSAPRDLVNGWIENKSLGSLFASIVTSDDVIRNKPNAEPYLNALNQLGITCSNSLAIEDSEIGATSSISAGIFTLGLGLANHGNFEDKKFLAMHDLFEAKKFIGDYLDL